MRKNSPVLPRDSVSEPFFEATAPSAGTRRLLLISYHFPPSSAAGALRWQKFAIHAAEREWGLDVVTLDAKDLTRPDTGRLAELPAGTRVFGVREPSLLLDRFENVAWFTLKRLLGLAKYRTARPAPGLPSPSGALPVDSRHRDELLGQRVRSPEELARAFHSWRFHAQDRNWALRAAKLARLIFQPGIHRAIVTCGPPHMVHMGGRRIAAGSRVPHIIDMRDPWSLVERLPAGAASPVALRLAERHERTAVRRAALVVANTEPARRALQERYPEHAAKIIAVMNGYDEEQVPAVAGGVRFSLAYAGTIYLDRNPTVLFRAAARLIREFRLAPHEFGIDLKGSVRSFNGMTVASIAEAEGIGLFVHTHAPGPRTEALELLASATMLISLPQDSDMAIPSKIFEYMQFPAWILAFATPESATGLALRGSGADVVAPDDVDATYAVLRKRFLQFRDGEQASPAEPGGPLSRRAQSCILFDELERHLARSAGKTKSAERASAELPRSGATLEHPPVRDAAGSGAQPV
ncbi:MAG: hypothetical protein H0X65_00545 [Gemmatimonadetes bacterium]|nr:hypothetical protein [Gemmatimonadota bacterium]